LPLRYATIQKPNSKGTPHMSPWDLLAWVGAISLIIVISGLTIAITVSFAKSLFGGKQKTKLEKVSNTHIFSGRES
jgi:hypothetical protein